MIEFPTRLTAPQLKIAAYFWQGGRMDTKDIAGRLGVDEHRVYNSLETIRRLSNGGQIEERRSRDEAVPHAQELA